jgi:hypothetical protein
MMDAGYRDPITAQLLLRQRQQQMQQQPPSPFRPAMPRQLPPAPMMGTPSPRQQEQSPYGFQSGFTAAAGGAPAYDPRARKDQGWQDLYDKLFGAAASAGGAAP